MLDLSVWHIRDEYDIVGYDPKDMPEFVIEAAQELATPQPFSINSTNPGFQWPLSMHSKVRSEHEIHQDRIRHTRQHGIYAHWGGSTIVVRGKIARAKL